MANSGQEPPSAHEGVGPVELEAILCTEELHRRPREPDLETENRLLRELAQALADSPQTILQKMADVMLESFRCGSAGFSLLTKDETRFSWPAIAGAWRLHIGGGTPRDFGPCGDVLDRDAPQLFRHCERRYEYLLAATPPIVEGLFAPFHVNGKAVGTIWVLSHSSRRRFDSEDLRLIQSLTVWASAAYQATAIVNASAQQRRAALNLMEDAIRDRLAVTRLAAVVESSDDAILSLDLDGAITTWNAGAQRLFGHTAEEALGKPVTLIVPPDRREEADRLLGHVRRGESLDQHETVRLRKDGMLVSVSETFSPIRKRQGLVSGASIIARDITASNRAAEFLRDADRRKNEFLAMLAHELRNPLAPIIVSLEILRREGIPKPSRETPKNNRSRLDPGKRGRNALDVVQRQVGQMVRLVDDLLDVGRISCGKIDLRKERVELAPIVRLALEAVRPLCETLNQELTISIPPSPILMDADPARLAQIVGNLLNNACKFTAPRGHIWLSVQREQTPGKAASEVVIRVRDSGIGIDRDQLPRVFELFMQVDTSLGRSLPGLGIGLTLVKTLVVMHGGTIEARSEGVGHGCEFIVRLPGAPVMAAPVALQKPAPRLRALRILIVDDNRDAANSLGTLLGMGGHEIQVAHDGLAAIDAVSRFNPEAVLLDIGLPGMNGYDVARKVRQMQGPSRRSVLVALTGWGQEEDRRRSEEAGFDAHVVKPVDDAALERLLADLGAGTVPPAGTQPPAL